MPNIGFDKPVLILDEQKARKNIASMAKKANDSSVSFRPHFKTHQSTVVGSWFREAGVTGITVSSISMAEYFANARWKSITIAFPVSHLQVKRLSKVASITELRILVVDQETVSKLDASLTSSLKAYIELDPGYQRSGIAINDYSKIRALKKAITETRNIEFHGFYTHSGHSYKCRSKSEILELVSPIISDLKEFRKEFKSPICFGDTPSCSVLDSLEFVDEVSPGNFAFYDWTQVEIGSCTPDHIAITMYCPIVAKYPERKEFLIHGGAIHFSKDSFTDSNNETHFGIIAKDSDDEFGKPLMGNFVKSLSQEHGIVTCTDEFFSSKEVGDFISILPIHSCLTAESMGTYHTLGGTEIDHMSKKSSTKERPNLTDV